MIKLEKAEYPKALALFKHSSHQMKLTALAEGRIDAQVWADAHEPAITIVLYQNKMLIASELQAEALVPVLKPFILEQAYEKKMGGGKEEALIFWDGENMPAALEDALTDKNPAFAAREYYELKSPADYKKAFPPEGYEMRAVDEALLRRALRARASSRRRCAPSARRWRRSWRRVSAYAP